MEMQTEAAVASAVRVLADEIAAAVIARIERTQTAERVFLARRGGGVHWPDAGRDPEQGRSGADAAVRVDRLLRFDREGAGPLHRDQNSRYED